MIKFRDFLKKLDEASEAGKYEFQNLNYQQALKLALTYMQEEELFEKIPNFENNFLETKRIIQSYSLGTKRKEMPRLSGKNQDVPMFKKSLEKGELDVKQPFVDDRYTELRKLSPDQWLTLGLKDGDSKDDIIKTQNLQVKAKDLKPVQTQIYIDKLFKYIQRTPQNKQGQANPMTKNIVVISNDNYIIDGHHRWQQFCLQQPDTKLTCLKVHLDIRTLLQVQLDYGDQLGNSRNG